MIAIALAVADGNSAARRQQRSPQHLDNQRRLSKDEELKEATQRFTFRGKPTNPLAIRDLLSLLTDEYPGPVAIAMEGTTEIRYFGGLTAKPKTDGSIWTNLEDGGYFGYQRLGVLANGIQVLKTWESGGGSGIFTSLLLVSFRIDEEYTEDGSRSQLVLVRRGEIGLGDRYDGEVQVSANSIMVGADKRKGGRPARIIRLE